MKRSPRLLRSVLPGCSYAKASTEHWSWNAWRSWNWKLARSTTVGPRCLEMKVRWCLQLQEELWRTCPLTSNHISNREIIIRRKCFRVSSPLQWESLIMCLNEVDRNAYSWNLTLASQRLSADILAQSNFSCIICLSRTFRRYDSLQNPNEIYHRSSVVQPSPSKRERSGQSIILVIFPIRDCTADSFWPSELVW